MIRKTLVLLSLLFLVATFFGAWGYLARSRHFFPDFMLRRIRVELRGFISKKHIQEIDNRYDFQGLIIRDKNFIDPGYILLPRYSREHNQAVVDLIRARDFKQLYRWVPPISEIIKQGKKDKTATHLRPTIADFGAVHPLLMEDGSIVFGHGDGYIARVDKDNRLLWVNGFDFHHSIEMDIDGNLVILINNPSKDFPNVRDDGYAIVSPQGKILNLRSGMKILLDNGYSGIIQAFQGVMETRDFLHLNDAQPILKDNGIAKRGDIILSFRNIHTIAIYRPKENKIIALQFGPWVLQHDPNILPDGRISLFNNFSTSSATDSGGPLSNVLIWNSVDGTTESPYEDVLKLANMHSNTGGRSRILPNGDVFIEETRQARLLRVSPETIRWEYVNASEEKPEVAQLMLWSRYYLPDEIQLDWLEEVP